MAYQPRQYPLIGMPQPQDPLSSLSNLMAVGSQLEGWQEQKKQRQQQERATKALNDAKGDYGKAADLIETEHGDFALGQTFREKARTAQTQARQQKNEEFGQMLQRADALPSMYGKAETLLNEVTPDTYARAVPVLRELATSIHPDLAAHIPEQYDPGQVDQMRQSVGVLKQKATRMADGLKQFLPDGNPVTGLTMVLGTVDTDEEREQILERARFFEMPDAAITVAVKADKDARAKAAAEAKKAAAEAKALAERGRAATIQAALLRADERGDNGAVTRLLALERNFQAAGRAPQTAGDDTDAVAMRQAESWLASELRALEALRRPRPDPDDPLRQRMLPSTLDDAAYMREVDSVYDLYRGMTGREHRQRPARAPQRVIPQVGATDVRRPGPAGPLGPSAVTASPSRRPPSAAPSTPTTQTAIPQASDFRMVGDADGSVRVTAPDGSTATFSSRAEADAAIAAFLTQPR